MNRAIGILVALMTLACASDHRVFLFPSAVSGTSTFATGLEHTCTVANGGLRCTGSNNLLQLGLTDAMDRAGLTVVPGVDGVISVRTGDGFTCVLDASGVLSCFGSNTMGELGAGESLDRRAEPREVELPGPIAQLEASFGGACAILQSGALYCWGNDGEDQLSQPNPVDRIFRTPVQVMASETFADVSMGQGHLCAIATDGALYCTGRNQVGECGLGAGAPDRISTLTRVGTPRYRDVACGQNHTCAIDEEGALYCWGGDREADGHEGPLGLATSDPQLSPVAIGTERDWTAVSVDTFHSCGLRGEGELWCWGRNAEGELGTGDRARITGPVAVSSESLFTQVDVARFYTCARRQDGIVLCAGQNRLGGLGPLGGDVLSLTPIEP
jgi:alpha-tubulin suppressor-like RCC1 family protein